MREMSLQRLFGVYRIIRVLGIESLMRYFLDIVNIIRFCDFS